MSTPQFYFTRKLCAVLFLVLVSSVSIAQQVIKGRIVSADSLPVEGANIGIKGSNIQTSSDQNGGFSITAQDDDVLVISNVGFATTEVRASNAALISLSQTANDLNEVVVTALGIKKEKKKLGYALQEVKGEEPDRCKGNECS